MVGYCAHLRHGFNGDDALNREVSLVTDIQVICGGPVLSTICQSLYAVNWKETIH